MSNLNLSENTIAIVKATVPVLAQHGLTIVSTMYRNLFRDNPEVRPLFNQANQSAGEAKTRASQLEAFGDQMMPTAVPGSQQMSLAQAVLAYASHIDNPAALLPAVARIANKHASLDIRPEHYSIVGKYLLGAIKEVLGEAATPEIIAAWAEAYGALASLFIQVENKLREESSGKAGGWTGFRPFVVAKRIQESEAVCSFYLEPQDGGGLPSYKAGQYLCFRVNVPDIGLSYRNYSLSTGPGERQFRVSIKREPEARSFPAGVISNYFHNSVKVGDVLDVAPPYGDFTLVESALPPVFIAAGIGITPMFSMLKSVLATNSAQPVHFISCMRNGRLHPLKTEVAEAVKQGAAVSAYTLYSDPDATDRAGLDYDTAGRLSFDVLRLILPDNQREFYFTGPVKFMRDLRTALHKWGVPSNRIHYECFGPHAAEIEADIS